MTRLAHLGISIVMVTAVLGFLAWATGIGYVCVHTGVRQSYPPFEPALFGALGLAYVLFTNRGYSALTHKSQALAFTVCLFAPIFGLVYQAGEILAWASPIEDYWLELAVYLFLLVFFFSAGNSVTTTRRESTGGIRNIWTISSRTVWFRTQRLHGRILVLGVLISLVILAIADLDVAILTLPTVYIASVAIATAYSAILANRLEPVL